MTSVDRAAVIWSIAIAAIGVGIAMAGLSGFTSSEVTVRDIPVQETEPDQQSAFMIGGVVQQSIPDDPVKIDSWIKNIASFWSQGGISDGEFTDSLEFLIKEKIIQSPEIRVLDEVPSNIVEEKTTVKVPSWIKFTAQIWAEGKSSDPEFANAIQFLIREKIISSPRIQVVDLSDDKITKAETTDSTGAETTDSTGAETTESTGAETTESTGAETTESTGAETTDSTGAETTEPLQAPTPESETIGEPLQAPSLEEPEATVTEVKDSDNDGLFDSADNCPSISNSGQENFDLDSKGDACDDSDGDLVFDDVDNCLDVKNTNQKNTDMEFKDYKVKADTPKVIFDSLGDACDDDKDGDGLSDEREDAWCTLVLHPDSDRDQKLDLYEIDNHDKPWSSLSAHDTDDKKCLDDDTDGLPNGAEEEIGTEFEDFSTDGDLYSDGEEYFGLFYPDRVLHDVTFDPLKASTPIIEVQITGLRLQLNEDVIVSETKYEKGENELSSYGDYNNALSVNIYAGTEGEWSSGTDLFGGKNGYTQTATWGIKAEDQFTWTVGNSWSETHTEGTERTEETTTNLKASSFTGWSTIKNVGNERLDELTKLLIGFYVGDDTVSCASYDWNKIWTTGHGTTVGLDAGSTSKPILFNSGIGESTDSTNIECFKRILNGEPVTAQIDWMTYAEPYGAALEKIKSVNLTLIIPTDSGPKTEFIHLQNTPLNIKDVFKTANTLPPKIVGGKITEFGNFKSNLVLDGKPNTGFIVEFNGKEMNNKSENVNDLLFNNGDTLKISYYIDNDEDRLPNTYEKRVTRTNPDAPDTDGDGLWDGTKTLRNPQGVPVTGWRGELALKCPGNPDEHYDPTTPNTDGDDMNDWDEHFSQGKRNACVFDTPNTKATAPVVVDEPENYETIWANTWSGGWDNIVPFELNGKPHLLYLKSSDGSVSVDDITPGKVKHKWGQDWSDGWDTVAPFELGGKPHILFLKSSSGIVEVDEITETTYIKKWRQDWSDGWDTVAAFDFNGKPHILFQKSSNGNVELDEITKNGYEKVWKNDWSSGWDIIVPFYDKDENGDRNPYYLSLKSKLGDVSIDRLTNKGWHHEWSKKWSSGWDTVAPLKIGGENFMLFLKSETGDVFLGKVTPKGVTQMWRTTWTSGWDTVAPFESGGEQYILFMKSKTGKVELDRIEKDCAVPNAQKICNIK